MGVNWFMAQGKKRAALIAALPCCRLDRSSFWAPAGTRKFTMKSSMNQQT
jgi:hypothetical protein